MDRICTTCNIEKPIEQFYRDRQALGGRSRKCKACARAYEISLDVGYIAKNKQHPPDPTLKKKCGRCLKVKFSGDFCRALRTRDGLQSFCKVCERERKLSSKYQLTQELFVAMVKTQKGKCAICQKEDGLRLVVDHNHDTGLVRGLLCDKCNRGIGFLCDNEAICQAASDYLTKAKLVS